MQDSLYNTIKIIGYYIGKIITVLGLIQVLPLIISLIYREWIIAFNFITSMSISLILGAVLIIICNAGKKRKIEWNHGMIIAAFSWFLGMFLCAIPYYLSGNYASFLDACFDVMSGFTTTGLVLIQDLDHVSNGINMWRHFLTYLGGQGMVVLALTFLIRSTSGSYRMYVGEAKDEKLLPNVINTAKAIWYISVSYLIVGTLALWITGMFIGLPADRAFLHGLWVFMAAWSTGGFAPQTQNILYYHSTWFEIATVIFFVIGSFNFALHYAVWNKNRKEIFKNIEIQSFTITATFLTILTIAGLMKLNVYPDFIATFRKGFYLLISGHTTTGFMNIYARQFFTEWGNMALLAVIISMLIGGSAASTAGGFKGLRMGIIFKGFIREIKRILLPESRIQLDKFHHIGDVILEEKHIRSAMFIVLAYILTFAIGTLGGVFFGYPLSSAAFESASVTGNVGLSIGITEPSMPNTLKIIYIVIMWVARLEFMSVLALLANLFYRMRRRWLR
ncbi:MAG: TrkH family potassium uptake protein [Actinobacteria bacterium]|nr:TrkH family potassium uptake protein [Actinomycetota bacterium]